MRDLDDAALELRLRGVLKEHLGALPLDLTVDTLDRRREARGVDRRFRRGRGITLLAAAALLFVGGALAAGSGFLRLPTVVPPVPSPSVVAVATASPEESFPVPSESASPSADPIPVAGPGGTWIPTGTMVTPRYGHVTVRLQDGRVMAIGGFTGPADYEQHLTSAEVYDPATGTWSAAGSISMPIVTATLLRGGTVLVLLGDPNGGPRSAAVYDPATETWNATGPMDPGAEESDDTFTVLRDGRVLLAGRKGAYVYDPASGTWTTTSPLVRECCGALAVLQDGRVLDIGGAQVYDPASGTWTATGKRNNESYGESVVVLPDGKVLVAGGTFFDGAYHDLDSAEVYDPVTESWTPIANMHATGRPTAAFLQPDGKVLVVGPGSHADVYDPATGTWTALPVRPGIGYSAATLLSDGAVLVTGEDPNADQSACTTADLYDPRTGSLTTASTMLGCGRARSSTPLLDGTVLVAGGISCTGDVEAVCISNGTAELYVPPGVPLPPLPAFPPPGPPVSPSPTPLPTLLPPAAGPVPPNAQSWKVTVDNRSSEPATLFVADEAWDGLRLVGSATPNVVPAGATEKVTFLFPRDGGWIYVNPRPGEGGSLVNADDIGIPGKIVIMADGQVGWLSP
jgi:N-acetylneuraminic acid mutarotase